MYYWMYSNVFQWNRIHKKYIEIQIGIQRNTSKLDSLSGIQYSKRNTSWNTAEYTPNTHTRNTLEIHTEIHLEYVEYALNTQWNTTRDVEHRIPVKDLQIHPEYLRNTSEYIRIHQNASEYKTCNACNASWTDSIMTTLTCTRASVPIVACDNISAGSVVSHTFSLSLVSLSVWLSVSFIMQRWSHKKLKGNVYALSLHMPAPLITLTLKALTVADGGIVLHTQREKKGRQRASLSALCCRCRKVAMIASLRNRPMEVAIIGPAAASDVEWFTLPRHCKASNHREEMRRHSRLWRCQTADARAAVLHDCPRGVFPLFV